MKYLQNRLYFFLWKVIFVIFKMDVAQRCYFTIFLFAHFLRKVNTRSSFWEERLYFPLYCIVKRQSDSVGHLSANLRKWCKCLFLAESKFWNWKRICVILKQTNLHVFLHECIEWGSFTNLFVSRLCKSLFNFEIAVWNCTMKPFLQTLGFQP